MKPPPRHLESPVDRRRRAASKYRETPAQAAAEQAPRRQDEQADLAQEVAALRAELAALSGKE